LLLPGQSHLIGGSQDAKEIVGIPNSLEPFDFDADASRAFLPYQIESDMTQNRQIMGGMTNTNTRSIFAESGVKHPIYAIFDPPMTADGTSKSLSIAAKAEKLVACFDGPLLAETPLGLRHANALRFCSSFKIRSPT
jgi:hypothetical protein